MYTWAVHRNIDFHLQIFDAVIVLTSFSLDLVFIEGITGAQSEEAIALLIIFLLWRILRIINGDTHIQFYFYNNDPSAVSEVHQKDIISRILIGYIILLPPEIVFLNKSQYYFRPKKYYVIYQTTIISEYEK